MKKIILTFWLLFIAILSFGQNAEELNKKSKDFLSQGDTKNAAPFLKQAAELGNAEAQYNLGYCYQQGIEVPKNDSIANTWLLKSAKQGWLNAQFKIAYSYAAGRGTNKNDIQAFFWSLQCAKQGDPECMFNVVSCYQDGIGTSKNIDSALTWATRLAILANAEDLQSSGKITSARANLAEMYYNGKNVPKNFAKSYMWFLIYNESKRDFSILVQQKNIDVIKEVEKLLTPAVKEKAKVDAEKLLNRKLTNMAHIYDQDL
ncbi:MULTISPECIES: tetratricopeptide repeat protein [unclassified Mucilaginibacter]|uniref:tetratricopeptide repeat protein n=1 Tax=unclassified Mucilaginibacter TaxID=2617802 RepID=UPI002AC98CF8|nr:MULTISPECIES: tetratricopeptide repeat protein [unclassified Mucilaginibacter]MEB0280865.1 tetratricopeptide repeat protein [Mucilaginibacter sp. 10B2]MEB0302754.1 tetratricopeptide repeat protein [Mucilaginibacter sp. 5C4]WPX25652.1 tetratricopeptide repeat protein [Mucilaginibacter sp. 5C4]